MFNSYEKRIMDFLLRHPDFGWRMIHTQYPMSHHLLDKYKEVLDWELICLNQAGVSVNIFEEYIHWGAYSANRNIHWRPKDAWEFRDRFVWTHKGLDPETPRYPTFSRNYRIFWRRDEIRKFRNYLDWDELSCNRGYFWTENILKVFDKRLNWEYLDPRCWSGYYDDFVRENIVKTPKPWHRMGVADNLRLAMEFCASLSWKHFSASTDMYWTTNLLYSLHPFLRLEQIAANPKAINNSESLKYILTKWEGDDKYRYLSRNPKLGWDDDLINRFRDKWDWEALSRNPGIPRDLEFIDRNLDWIKFGLSVPLNKEKTRYYTLYEGLSGNPELNWSFSLVEKYEDRWDYYTLSQNRQACLLGILINMNDEMVDLFLRITQ